MGKALAPPIVLQAAYQLRKVGAGGLTFSWKAKVFNHYGYSWGCKHDHPTREEARSCALTEITRLKAG